MDAAVISAVRQAAQKDNVPPANLYGVVMTESAGRFQDRGRPLIRIEGHYFYRLTSGSQRIAAVNAKLASPTAGAIKNPTSQDDRYAMLERMKRINMDAAISSCSWGLGQVMGAHWQALGFASATELERTAHAGIGGQIELMMRFCRVNKLIDELQRGDFAGFARIYNGPAYKTNKYDEKMAQYAKEFVAKFSSEYPARTTDGVPANNPHKAYTAETMVRAGTSGAQVREVQELLHRAGYAIAVDGDFGPATKRAVEDFQRVNGLTVDGLVGPNTWKALKEYQTDPDERPGVPGAAEAVMVTPEGRQGAVAVGAGLTIIGVQEAVQTATETLSGVVGTSPVIDAAYAGLTTLGVLLTFAGIARSAYGYVRATTTRGVRQ